MEAIELGENSLIYQTIMKAHAFTELEMDSVVGLHSFMHVLFFAAQNNIAMKYNCKKICDNTIMFAIQWAN